MSEEEGAVEVYEKIVQLKMLAPDGKKRETDAADMTGIFRIIQSIPSPKAEPFKMWRNGRNEFCYNKNAACMFQDTGGIFSFRYLLATVKRLNK